MKFLYLHDGSWAWPLVVIIAIIIAWIIYSLIGEICSPLRKIPGPSSWSPWGQALVIMKEEATDSHYRWSQQYGGIFCYRFPIFNYRLSITHPDFIKHILVTRCGIYRKPLMLKRFLQPTIGEGLLLLDGPKHARIRKIINPTFKYSKIKEMLPAFQNFADTLIDVWSKTVDDNGGEEATLEVHRYLSQLTLDIICKCAFDYESNALTDEGNNISQSFKRVLSELSFGLRYFIPGYRFLPTKSNMEAKRALDCCHHVVQTVINKKMKQENNSGESCLLDILLTLRDEENNVAFTKQELQDHIMTFMSAGHETTSVALTWTLYELAKNPEIQSRVRQEIFKFLDQQSEITWDTLDELVYLGKVIKESLRLYPPAPITFRQPTADDEIGGFHIPKGTICAIVAPHRSPDFFPDPLRFDPDRWDTTAKNVNQYAYLPFLGGPRICIGSKFAMVELKAVLVKLLSKFIFKPIPNQEYKRKLLLTMRPDPPLKLLVSHYSSIKPNRQN